MKDIISTLLECRDLSSEEAYRAMSLVMSGQATDAQIAGFLIALRMKGESVGEITGCARAMREAATGIDVGDIVAIDTCGTGGDGCGTFNVSTAAAIVTAAAGVPVAKHGNRSVSSASGSADVLQQMGVNIEASVAVVEKCIRTAGIGFLFAPMLHNAMKHAIGPRRQLGVRTIFNVLGPLTNPAGVKYQVMGIYSDELLATVAGVLRNLGSRRAMVVHSSDGMDEISAFAPTGVAELRDGKIKSYSIRPEDFGVVPGDIADLKVKDAVESAGVIRAVLRGESGPARDIVALNAGAAIYTGEAAPTLAAGMARALEAIDSGAAAEKLNMLCECSRS